MTTFNAPQKEAIAKAMLEAGCTPQQARTVTDTLTSGTGNVHVTQSAHTVAPGATMIGYQADTIG